MAFSMCTNMISFITENNYLHKMEIVSRKVVRKKINFAVKVGRQYQRLRESNVGLCFVLWQPFLYPFNHYHAHLLYFLTLLRVFIIKGVLSKLKFYRDQC